MTKARWIACWLTFVTKSGTSFSSGNKSGNKTFRETQCHNFTKQKCEKKMIENETIQIVRWPVLVPDFVEITTT